MGLCEPRQRRKRAPSASPFSVLPSRPVLGPELGIRNRGTPPLLPGAAITRLGIFAQAHLSPHSDRSLVLNAAFRSTAMMFRVATDPHSHVDVPGLHLRTRPVLSLRPFGFPLPVLAGSFNPVSRHLCVSPVAQFDPRTLRLPPCRRSPPGPCDPSGSLRSTRLQPEKLTIAGRSSAFTPRHGCDHK